MGFMDFIRELGMHDDIKYNFNKRMSDFKSRHPDVSVYRQHDIRPCPYYFTYEDSDGKRYAEFYYSSLCAKVRWEKMKEINAGSFKIHGLGVVELFRDIYYK